MNITLLENFLSTFSLSGLNLNWVDLIVLIGLTFYAIEGYSLGFAAAALDLISFVISFIFGLKTYSIAGNFLRTNFSISPGFSNALGFLISATFFEIILGIGLRKIIYSRYFDRFNLKGNLLKNSDKALGTLFGILSGLILFAFLLTIVIALPVSPFLKHSVSDSRIGNLLISQTQGFEKELNNIFGGAVNETLNFLTVEPRGNESVDLKFRAKELTVDLNAEKDMLEKVNRERTLRGLKPVALGEALREVARNHCGDMFERGYFSHYTPEGLSPFDRMAEADISFNYAGENLALAPNVSVAMQGLMNSSGHRANILNENFGRLGVGVIDGGIYGQMFCQEFKD